ncbi:MAG: DUF1422 family protein [Oceanisphaera sp.]
MGTNFLSVMISLVLVIWLALKMGVAARPVVKEDVKS